MSKSYTPKEIVCYYCYRVGHIRKYCWKLKKDLKDKRNERPSDRASVVKEGITRYFTLKRTSL